MIIRDSVRHNKLVNSVYSMKLLKLFVLNNLLFQCYSLKGYDLWSRTWWSNGCFNALSQGERRFWGDTECVGTLCFQPRFEMAILERNISCNLIHTWFPSFQIPGNPFLNSFLTSGVAPITHEVRHVDWKLRDLVPWKDFGMSIGMILTRPSQLQENINIKEHAVGL